MSPNLRTLLLAASLVLASGANALINTDTSLSILYQNNLNSPDDINHEPFLLLDAVRENEAAAACSAQNEKLLPSSFLATHRHDVERSLAYLEYAGYPSKAFFVHDGVLTTQGSSGRCSVSKSYPSRGPQKALPVLCTQSRQGANSTNAIISSNSNTYVGSRAQKSFSFLGVPFANPPARFSHSQLYTSKHQTIQAQEFPSPCAQVGSGSEDCLYLNLWTPYIPKQGSKTGLKPVLLWIHGGGFTGGNGQADGGNLASREDIVFVSIQYRLSTLGFLAVPGTDVKGNYGIGDQVTALNVSRGTTVAAGE